VDGGLPRHVVTGGTIQYEKHDQFDWSKDFATITANQLPETGTNVEKVAIKFFSQRCYPTFFPNGTAGSCPSTPVGPPNMTQNTPPTGFIVNGLPLGPQLGAPFADPGVDDNGKPINGDKTRQDGMEQPVYFWTPDIAPSGIGFYTGKLFPAWQGDLFVAELVGRSLVRLTLNGERVVGEERLLTELNSRIRGVNEGPDGALYVLTDGNGGKILRLAPVEYNEGLDRKQFVCHNAGER